MSEIIKSLVRVGLYVDRSHPKKNGLCNVKVRLHYKGRSYYVKSDIDISPDLFDAVYRSKRIAPKNRPIESKLKNLEQYAESIVDNLRSFSIKKFKEIYFKLDDGHNDIGSFYEDKIVDLQRNNQFSSMEGYMYSLKKLRDYFGKESILFNEIGETELVKIYDWYIAQGNSGTTASIHFECLRHIYNRAATKGKISQADNPFGRNKYQIRKKANVKKGVPKETIKAIVDLDLKHDAVKEKARDFWLLCFYLSGINLKDLMSIKKSQVEKDSISYIRSKTKNKQTTITPIRVYLPDEAKKLIEKYKSPKGVYLFELLEGYKNPADIRKKVKNFNRYINQHMKKIGESIGYAGNLSINSTRHSFASIAANQGVSTYFLKEALGHSSLAVTENYIKGLELNTKAKITESIFKAIS